LIHIGFLTLGGFSAVVLLDWFGRSGSARAAIVARAATVLSIPSNLVAERRQDQHQSALNISIANS
jgi:hypothetical protein